MKVFTSLIVAFIASLAAADKAPYPPSGWKPQGQLLELPQKDYGPPPQQPPQSYGPPPQQPPQSYGPPPQQPPQSYGPPPQQPPQSYGPSPQQPPQSPPSSQPPNEYGPPQNGSSTQPEGDLDKVNEQIMERLRKEEGSETGSYYVYLPNGKLQRVQYTTAPLKAANQQDSYQSGEFIQQTAFNGQSSGPLGTFAKQQTSYDVPINPQASSSYSQYKQSQPEKLVTTEKVASEEPNKYVASVSYTDVQPISGPIYSYNSQPLVRVLRYAPLYQ